MAGRLVARSISSLFCLQASRLFRRMGIEEKSMDLTEYELTIAAQLVDPSSIETTWSDIAGLDNVIDDIKATVIMPLRSPDLFARSDLHQAPKGVLLHGPPGCGKTMLAKATAKEAGARYVRACPLPTSSLSLSNCRTTNHFRFINLEVPALTDKWYGESQKLAAAVFTLAVKVQPCIVFIDEIDSFLRSRSSQDHEATAMMKAQFMMLWDGISSSKRCQVVVMGATNRPLDVDRAILRRMPAMFQIDYPGKGERMSLLQLILRNDSLASDVDLEAIAEQTDKFSGSDLRELCRIAAMIRIRELRDKALANDCMLQADDLRGISGQDFESALAKMKVSKRLAAGRELFADHGLD